ncbi:MAG TPA: LLM class F420-dependent oxidoreductase [Candidatus Binataceae bacterium]|nr:LLM class F420-dependent oxidoreductase [Candidatus Binataceae bacterium]
MKIGFFAIGLGHLTRPDLIKTVAVNAERLNFATIWAPEHVVLLDKHISKYPYSEGEFPVPADTPFADPFVTLGYAAAYTSRIKLVTGICLVPEHNPVVLAKVVATLDQLSGGRFTLGVGVGWLEEEFQAIGVPWERRAQRTREYIEAMRCLWRDAHSSYHGEFVNFDNVRSYPKPVRREVPIWFGGESGPALRRVAEYGNGWCGFNLSADEAAAKLKRIDELLKAAGRKRSELYMAISPYSKPITRDDLKRYRDAGIDELGLIDFSPPTSEREMVAHLEQMAREWVEPAARL